jgi:hypothetical protein
VTEADALGLKQVSAECSMLLGASLLTVNNAAGAQDALNAAVTKAERLGARAVMARSHFLLAQALTASGKAAEAEPHLRQVRSLAGELQKESAGASLASRRDLAPIFKAAS